MSYMDLAADDVRTERQILDVLVWTALPEQWFRNGSG